ncbi:nuclear transport factor 2 family protein [Candidatus Mycobacterium wuenschmannii]|uniref:Nuclear transport factor 2 family protein n=1 Tax=Candidatus Mycobacterium wuenschmannii TaxID=3027808 RepID=A0ABY8VV31_9MYCO|nr:nuclear transport factor 2 family protein [Candidatus Mycobacterium wuenschmannii]WIM86796.1 nuclear transport factor 2 family protein [Candidatus Mycobacterium wuenschmannii]
MPNSDDLHIWVDKAALTELVARLAAAADRADKAGIIECYAPQSYDDHGAFKGSGSEFAEMICAPDSRAGQLTMHHLLGQSVFDVDGDNAWGETFFVMHALIGGQVVASYGRYIDYFRRLDGDWKVSYRRVVPDVTIPGDDPAQYWPARRDRTDPRYDRRTAPPT